MTSFRRFTAPASGLLAAIFLAACGSQLAPTRDPAASVPATVPAVDVAARDAYNSAICPVFSEILALDPRLAAMREAGAAGGDMSAHAKEITAIGDELLLLLTHLEAVPEWTAGAGLRFQLITALHGVRAHLLRVENDPTASSAGDTLAAVPFISSEAMDLAMQEAVQGGLTCEPGS